MICKVLPENKEIECQPGETLLAALHRGGVMPASPCGGKGVCGKCAVQVTKGRLPVSAEDARMFSPEALAKGFRLSCCAVLQEDITIRIETEERDLTQISAKLYGLDRIVSGSEADILAVDIGTTTIAFALYSGKDRQVRAIHTMSNHQRAFGADVISRIAAAGEGKAEELMQSVKADILEGIRVIGRRFILSGARLYITGNTTMEHLLLGYDTKGLGVFPFTPVSLETYECSWEQLFHNREYTMSVTVMPGFTTYVGADILAGVLSCSMLRQEKPSVLIDLGTNGEMALCAGGKLYVTSTAAGPAFEGGNISCGMAGIDGAISKVRYDGSAFCCETIGGGAPEGICGSGLVDAVAACVRHELIDETGLLDEDAFEDGLLLAVAADGREIRLTQQDIRQMQLAKSAVRAGMETLIKRAGLSHADIGTVYLAGGFGQYIDLDSAVEIGMFDADLKDKMTTAGNTALSGALYFAAASDGPSLAARAKAAAEEIDLSSDPDFGEGYMEYMMFGEDVF